ncbi:uncharacterized protein [Spinacia oleracea]|uniref:No apical meristem-associated C-terminal domain-containing protein n=1 Tax=Spinacia oleracea TaxID=3562 RepID=A0A9R0KAX9_SPIOL|nr:uncharacterized protein LOC110803723 [Spinacia oleracea]
MSIITTPSQPEIEQETEPLKLTYRQQRRLDQAALRLKFPGRKRRGPTRGIKYAPKGMNSEEKVTVTFLDELRRVVGEKANEFICDCSNWVEEFCPLNSVNWAKMDPDQKQRLYDKILGKYNLPEKVGGANVVEALSFQCSILYRHWRFRLKEAHYRGKTKAQARANKPPTVDKEAWRISKINTENKLRLTETPANGSRSTARICYDMMNEPPVFSTQDLEGSSEPVEVEQEPIYLRLFEKTKKHKKKDGGSGWEPIAEKNYEELKKLHEAQIEEHGKDTLNVKDAYIKVLKPKSGYVRGLGSGARPPKKGRNGENNERVELSTQVNTLSASNEELRVSNEQLKGSNEELKASNEELKAEFSRMNKEAIEREQKLREDMLKMFEDMRNNGSKTSS